MLGAAAAGPMALAWPSQSRAAARLARARVVVIGAGFGGATAARELRRLSGGLLEVILIEPRAQFISCPLSNQVVAGFRPFTDLIRSYGRLDVDDGIICVRDWASAIDLPTKTVRLVRGGTLRYDKLVLAPGVEMMFEAVEGLRHAQETGQILQAWTGDEEIRALWRQLEAMRDGGVFALSIPEIPYRCPPAPYERACLVAAYLKRHKPRSKVLVLDANPDVTAQPERFRAAWQGLYGGLIEYRAEHQVTGVDARTRTVRFDVQEDVRADVLNILPPMRAGAIAQRSGLANINARWCEVDFPSFASIRDPAIHVLGDSIQTAAQMPKSAQMANSHAKVAALAVVAELSEATPQTRLILASTCYSFIARNAAFHVETVHDYVPALRTFRLVPRAGAAAPAPSAQEAQAAWVWARALWADTLGAQSSD